MTASRRILFSTLSGYGHFHPLVPLAQGLHAQGHEIAFASASSLSSRVEALGFHFFPVDFDRNADEEYQEFRAYQRQHYPPLGLETELYNYHRQFCGIRPRLALPPLIDAARQWQPDLIVREAGEYAAVIAAELIGKPHITVAFAAALQTMSVFERDAASQLDPIRQRWGLPPDPNLDALYRHLYLAYSPPTFATQDMIADSEAALAPIPTTTRYLRPQIADNIESESLPAWIADLPAQSTVYLTLGTEANKEPMIYPGVLQTIISGLRDAPINLIVTLGRGKDPADFGAQPANVHIEPYIPQSLLLPHCDLMVMHGGSNSLLAALDVGLPLVIVPLIADQFFNAHVTQRLTLGETVSLDALSPENILTAVNKVLIAPVYRQTAAALRDEMHGLPEQQCALELVGEVLRATSK